MVSQIKHSNRINYFHAFIASLSLLFIWSCAPLEEEIEHYSFYVVGHAYGNPIEYQYGIYPPLAKFFPYLNIKENIEFGVFTGDVVPKATAAYWDSAMTDLNTLEKPFYIAPGNHDRGEEFDRRFNTDTSFQIKNDHFIILNTDGWMVNSQQQKIISDVVNIMAENSKLFIFCHELIWWAPDNEYSKIEINYRPHYPGETNFYSEILPDLNNLSQEVFWIAGDVGCKPECTPYVLNQIDNVHLIANGVGGGAKDNCLMFDVSSNGEVNIFAVIFDKYGRPRDFDQL